MGVWKSIKRKVFDWHSWDEWVEEDTVLVHKVLDEHGASCRVQTYYGKQYRHKDTGERRRRLGNRAYGRPCTIFKTRGEIERSIEVWEIASLGGTNEVKSIPSALWLDNDADVSVTSE